MCGIVGVIGAEPAAPLLLEALRRLEYRGYDSAGIATLVDGGIERRRAPGKLGNLAAELALHPLPGLTGIGHTRWATHGAPTQRNAHPHGTPRVSVVHNGIIENHAELRAELEAAGQSFQTETDTETVAQLIDLNLAMGMEPIEAARAAFKRLEGAYAVALIFAGHPELMIGAQHGAPLAIGFGESAMYLGSDSMALAPMTRRIAYLHDGDWAVISRDDAAIFGPGGGKVNRPIKVTVQTGAVVGKDGYRHFMEKELHEHPAAIGQTLARMLDPAARVVTLPEMPFDWKIVPRLTIAGCGSTYYAGLAGRHWMEELARLPSDIDIASEFRYRTPPMGVGGVGLLVSQSGETADTLAALRFMPQRQKHKREHKVNLPFHRDTPKRRVDAIKPVGGKIMHEQNVRPKYGRGKGGQGDIPAHVLHTPQLTGKPENQQKGSRKRGVIRRQNTPPPPYHKASHSAPPPSPVRT